jgi:hypothetical protein
MKNLKSVSTFFKTRLPTKKSKNLKSRSLFSSLKNKKTAQLERLPKSNKFKICSKLLNQVRAKATVNQPTWLPLKKLSEFKWSRLRSSSKSSTTALKSSKNSETTWSVRDENLNNCGEKWGSWTWKRHRKGKNWSWSTGFSCTKKTTKLVQC